MNAARNDSHLRKRGVSSRKLAVEVLLRVQEKGAYTNIALANALEGSKYDLAERDRAFITALVQGVLRNKNALDKQIGALASKPVEKIQPPLLNVLRIAFFQLDQMSDIPESAVVDTAVELGRVIGHAGHARFINGILRSYLRQRAKKTDEIAAVNLGELSESDAIGHLSDKYSMPSWLVQRWLQRYGAEEAEKLLAASSTPAKLTLRVNDIAMETDGYQRLLADKGVISERSKLVPTCLIIKDRKNVKGPVEKLPGYAEGIFSVQDEAAAFVTQVMAPQSSDVVIDLCAAPGGKTLNIAEMMNNKGRIIAIDKHEKRLNMVKENRLRLGLTNIETYAADGTTYEHPPVDKVLVDAPCSGTGVINKRSDIRLKLKEEDIAQVNIIQKALLTNAAKLVKPGGCIVYSTCSIEPEENEQILDWFMQEFSDFERVDLRQYFPENTAAELNLEAEAEKGFALFLPSRHDFSGFFVAKMQRKQALAVE
jgi:16S rRNA (cytosine967-C5)-methyltransferase